MDKITLQGKSLSFTQGSWLQFVRGALLKDGTLTWATFDDRPDFSPREGDITYVVSKSIRPEQIAREVYGVDNLWWVIAVANGMFLPMIEMAPGVTLRIPDPDFVRGLLHQAGSKGDEGQGL